MTSPLTSTLSKVRRADAHIVALDKAVRDFLLSKPYRIEPKLSRSGKIEVWSVVPDPIPEDIELIASDAVHNLRTPLDKMLTASFRHTNVHERRSSVGSIFFPTGDSRQGFEKSLIVQSRHLKPEVIEFLETLEPYHGGRGEILWVVNRLDTRDKHRALLVTIKVALEAAHVSEVKLWQGALLSLGSRRGQHLVPVPDAAPGQWHLHQPDEKRRPILRNNPVLARGTYLEFVSEPDDMEIMTTTPGSQIQATLEPRLSVGFNQLDAIRGLPVLRVLKRMRDAVHATVVSFEKSFHSS